MIQIYKTFNEINPEFKLIDNIEPGCWINLIAPSDEELLLISKKTKVPIEFLKAPLDDEETSRIDIEDNTIVITVNLD